MHRPSTETRPSIYYDYKVHKPWLPSPHAIQERKKVVIAGSGPAGMVAALPRLHAGLDGRCLRRGNRRENQCNRRKRKS
jgi:3-(3-hydroxy-phenyl)propionate hydroxylase